MVCLTLTGPAGPFVMLFWVSLAVLTIFGRAAQAKPGDDEQRLAVFRDRKREITAEQQSGRLSDEEAERALNDLARQLSEELPTALRSATAPAASAAPTASTAAAAAPSSPPSRRGILATALVVAVVVPLAALMVYGQLGAPQLTDPATLAAQPGADTAQIDVLAAEIERRVQTHPDEGEAWAMLAEARKLQNRLEEAARAFEEARKRLPPNARLLTDYAETLVMAAGGDFSGRPVELLEEALRVDADEPKAIALMGAAQYRLGNLERAHGYLKRLYDGLAPDSPEAQQIGAVLARVSAELAQRGTTPAEAAAPSLGAAAPGPIASAPAAPGAAASASSATDERHAAAQVGGTIRIADALAAQVPAGATLFIVAREVDGPRIPVAVARIGGPTLPYAFTLGDQQAMDPARLLSRAGSLTIEARLSASG
ncbi:MAG: c-type cytochrome biogenesis protein CcmI, partial [Burkholderiales bacterium]|nr:c-type cytochrome biogenesis protein CcmI [Burkholderiales bacterium]